MAKNKNTSYEQAMKELEDLLMKVENDEINIDDLSALVKRSVKLIKDCKSQLTGIESDIDQSLKDISE